MIARLLAAVSLPLAAAALALSVGAPAHAEDVDENPDDTVVEGPRKPADRAWHFVSVEGVAEAQAYLTPARGGRLDVRLGLRGKAATTMSSMIVRAAPCERWDPEHEDFVCRAGARRTTVALRAGALSTASLTIVAPPRATDTVMVTAGTTARPMLVWMAIPATAWRGALAGRPVGATLGDDGANVVATMADLQLITDHRGRPRAVAHVDVRDRGTARVGVGIESTLRRCAAPVAACRLDTARETSDPGFRYTVDLGRTDALTWPARAGAVLTVGSVARPSNRVLATARLPWPDR